jgi:hypothetical protein
MAFIVGAAQKVGAAFRHAPDNEERRFHAIRRKEIEDVRRVRRHRSVVEGEHDFAVGERQRLLILKNSDPRVLARVDD